MPYKNHRIAQLTAPGLPKTAVIQVYRPGKVEPYKEFRFARLDENDRLAAIGKAILLIDELSQGQPA